MSINEVRGTILQRRRRAGVGKRNQGNGGTDTETGGQSGHPPRQPGDCTNGEAGCSLENQVEPQWPEPMFSQIGTLLAQSRG